MANAIAQLPAVASYSGTTVTKAFASGCTNPSLLIAMMTSDPVPTAGLSFSDSVHGSWGANDVQGSEPTDNAAAIGSIQNTSTSTITITGTSTTSTNGFMQILEATGLATTSALDTTGTQNDLNPPSISVTAAANDLIVAVYVVYPSPGAVMDSGYTLFFGPTAAFFSYHMGEGIADAGGAGTKTLTWNGTGTPIRQIFLVAAYKTAGSPPAGGGAPLMFNGELVHGSLIRNGRLAA